MGLLVVVFVGCVVGMALGEKNVEKSVSDRSLETARELVEQGMYRKLCLLRNVLKTHFLNVGTER